MKTQVHKLSATFIAILLLVLLLFAPSLAEEAATEYQNKVGSYKFSVIHSQQWEVFTDGNHLLSYDTNNNRFTLDAAQDAGGFNRIQRAYIDDGNASFLLHNEGNRALVFQVASDKPFAEEVLKEYSEELAKYMKTQCDSIPDCSTDGVLTEEIISGKQTYSLLLAGNSFGAGNGMYRVYFVVLNGKRFTMASYAFGEDAAQLMEENHKIIQSLVFD